MSIVLLGGGGHASDVLGAIEALNAAGGGPHEVIGIVADSDVDMGRFASRGVKQIGSMEDLKSIGATHYISCVGYPKGRKSMALRAASAGLEPITIVHPNSWVPPDVILGRGTVILAGVCISPLASIGDHAYLAHGCLVGHDARVGDYVSIMPGASVSGDTHLEEGCTIGASATVLEKRRVGAGSTIGAGAVVTSDIPPGVIAKGIPARYPEAG